MLSFVEDPSVLMAAHAHSGLRGVDAEQESRHLQMSMQGGVLCQAGR